MSKRPGYTAKNERRRRALEGKLDDVDRARTEANLNRPPGRAWRGPRRRRVAA